MNEFLDVGHATLVKKYVFGSDFPESSSFFQILS